MSRKLSTVVKRIFLEWYAKGCVSFSILCLSTDEIRDQEAHQLTSTSSNTVNSLGRPFIRLHQWPYPITQFHHHLGRCGQIFQGGSFRCLSQKHTDFKVALLFLDMVYKLQGFPCKIVSNWDPLFISKFWQELFCLSGMKL